MAHLIKFPKIGQFRNVVTDIKHAARFDGLDEQGEPKYNHNKLPVVTFVGTTKVHGTNAAVCIQENELWVQSRENIVTEGHFGFVNFVKENEVTFRTLLHIIRMKHNLPSEYSVALFGEWAGPGIQKGVGVSELPEKTFFIFGLKVVPIDEEGGEVSSFWLDHEGLHSTNPRIKNIAEFGMFGRAIDFSEPKMVINELIDITNKIEAECPVAKAYGVSGVGEGVVWVGTYKGKNYRFKVKGDKHSNTKVKKLTSVDPEKLASIKETVDYLVTEQRLDQAIQVTGAELDRKYTGDVMRWLSNDIMGEETDTLTANGLAWKDIASQVTGEYRRLFFQRIDNNL